MVTRSKSKSRKSITNRNSLLSGFGLGNWLFHPLLWFAVATISMIAGANHLWNKLHSDILPTDGYRVTADTVTLTPVNAWIDVDLNAKLKGTLANNTHSLLEPQLISEIAVELAAWPFVKHIDRLEKNAVGIKADLTYRSPIAIVETIVQAPKLVDADGVIIPGRFRESSSSGPVIENYAGKVVEPEPSCLRIFVDRPVENGLEDWARWPDPRVIDAALVAEQINPVAHELGISSVVNWPEKYSDALWPYELWTAVGGKVIWSDNPKSETQESCEAKRKLLTDWVARNGSLDQLADFKKLDVRNGRAILVSETPDVAWRTILKLKSR